MTGTSYRVPIKPMPPGSDGKNLRILESMPVRSASPSPANGTTFRPGPAPSPCGARPGRATTVARVEVTIDVGATWIRADLMPTRNRYDWIRWTANVACPPTVITRSGPRHGLEWPDAFRAANWNPKGYGGNAMHRVAVLVG